MEDGIDYMKNNLSISVGDFYNMLSELEKIYRERKDIMIDLMGAITFEDVEEYIQSEDFPEDVRILLENEVGDFDSIDEFSVNLLDQIKDSIQESNSEDSEFWEEKKYDVYKRMCDFHLFKEEWGDDYQDLGVAIQYVGGETWLRQRFEYLTLKLVNQLLYQYSH